MEVFRQLFELCPRAITLLPQEQDVQSWLLYSTLDSLYVHHGMQWPGQGRHRKW